MNLNSSIGEIKGIGEKTQGLFEKLGIYTVRDMLLAFPRDYKKFPEPINISGLIPGKECAVMAKVSEISVAAKGRRLPATVAKISDGSGTAEAVWYHMPYLKNSLKRGISYIFFGKISQKMNRFVMEQPAIYSPEQYRDVAETYQPVYRLIKGITNNLYKKAVRQACGALTDEMEFLPGEIIKRYQFVPYRQAVYEMHFPTSLDRLQAAHDTLAFHEFFLFLLSMQGMKENRARQKNECQICDTGVIDKILKKLPYALTDAQKRALDEILGDLSGAYSMQRLLQGDVGSGKTIIAFLAMAVTAANGYQSAIMAPTEVLARQHYETFCQWRDDFGLSFPILLLTGSFTAREKREIYERMRNEDSALIIGTHALIQEKADYRRLGLVITDEQHRFGVRQREILSQKGVAPHILAMSATPIPRTLAIILYGNFDISVIDELPARRLPIKSCVVNESYRDTAYSFIEREVSAGRQAYIICPLVEESENMDAENVTDYVLRLRRAFRSDVFVACLHGKMKPKEKNEIMEAFLRGEIQVLVSTTVVEVGVNVPNATVMMIENAERFGLAQLHQLRGRVGRGNFQSYCIFMNLSDSRHAKERLEIMNSSNDGFKIAEEDLKLRGPGDFFGIRQSGMLEFAVGDVFGDARILSAASEECRRICVNDGFLQSGEHVRLREALKMYQKMQSENVSI